MLKNLYDDFGILYIVFYVACFLIMPPLFSAIGVGFFTGFFATDISPAAPFIDRVGYFLGYLLFWVIFNCLCIGMVFIVGMMILNFILTLVPLICGLAWVWGLLGSNSFTLSILIDTYGATPLLVICLCSPIFLLNSIVHISIYKSM